MAFKSVGIISIFLFTFLLCMAIYISYFFLYRQKRYRIYFVSCFYGFAYVIILARLTLAVLLTYIMFNYTAFKKDVEMADQMLKVILTLSLTAC